MTSKKYHDPRPEILYHVTISARVVDDTMSSAIGPVVSHEFRDVRSPLTPMIEMAVIDTEAMLAPDLDEANQNYDRRHP